MNELKKNQIGTVEIIGDIFRVYPLKSEDPTGTQVCVDPGSYPLYQTGEDRFWVMTGRINEGAEFESLGGGMFIFHPEDRPGETWTTFESFKFNPTDWADLLSHPVCTEGNPAQRLRITLF